MTDSLTGPGYQNTLQVDSNRNLIEYSGHVLKESAKLSIEGFQYPVDSTPKLHLL